MATIAAAVTRNDDATIKVLWETLTATDNVGSDYTCPAGYKLATVQIVGTFGGTVTVAASLDGTNFTTGEDIASTALSVTAAGLFNVHGYAKAWHPTAGAGVSDVDVIAYFVPG